MKRALALTSILILWMSALSAHAADIAGNDGWLPLSEAVARYGIDPAFVDQALDAGGELGCIRAGEDGQYHYASLNGWFVAGDMGHILTNGHFMYKPNGETGDVHLPRDDDFSNCYLATNRDVLESANSSKYRKLMVNPHIANYMLGGTDPAGFDIRQDRALVPLVDSAPQGVVAFEEHSELFNTLVPGSEIYMLSSGRFLHDGIKGGFEPVLQRCTVLAIEPSAAFLIGIVATDCDSQHGMSASRMFVPVAGPPVQLMAVGIAARSQVTYANGEFSANGSPGLPADVAHNSLRGIATNPPFYRFICDGTDVVAISHATPARYCDGLDEDH